MKNFKKKSESDEQSIEQLNKQLKGKNETITNLNKNIQKMNQDIEQVTAKSQNQITGFFILFFFDCEEMQNMEAENNSLKKKIKESSEKMESFEEISSERDELATRNEELSKQLKKLKESHQVRRSTNLI
jgi:chromosome segregation ATPase